MSERIFITGASSGIGEALATSYRAAGAEVFNLSRRHSRIPGLKEVSCDMAFLDELPTALERLLDGVKTLDLVILNAALLGDIRDLRDTSVRALKSLFDVNVWANKVILDWLFENPLEIKQVVAMSSGAAVSAKRGWGGYSLSKAALNMLVGLYAEERPGTHFSAIAPGIVDTPMQAQLAATLESHKFPTVEQLKTFRGTPIMPPADQISGRLIKAFAKAKTQPTGSFLDLRQLGV